MSSFSEPWLRRNIGAAPCPFCGEPELRSSDQWPDSVHEDPLRLDIKCGNVDCPVRYFAELATVTEGHEAERRGDVNALRAVDRGYDGEKEASGDDTGMKHHVATRTRRERKTKVMIEPVDD